MGMPAGQPHWNEPPEAVQVSPVPHTMLQPPQCWGDDKFVSQPSSGLVLLQSPNPPAHEPPGIAHLPATQDTGAPDLTLGRTPQSLPQPPQFWGSLFTSVHLPAQSSGEAPAQDSTHW
jgi:hypothetical protein